MALTVPDTIPSKASQGEKRLYKILQYELPDDCYVWYEPRLKGLFPDFIILSPTLGLLILEVKGWSKHQIVSANSQFFEVKRGERLEREQSPLRQSKGYLDACIDKLKQYPILTQPDGDYKGKLAFPVGCGVVMSNLAEGEARDENVYTLLEPPQVAYKNELMDWDGIGERELVRRLEKMFTARFRFLALTDDQISTIKGILYPEKGVKLKKATKESVPAGAKLPENCSVIETLDIEQERLAVDIREGHRLFYGVAGSGKTLILLSRAKLLANREEKARVLVLCFNIPLAANLRSLLHNESESSVYRERIQVTHFHDWAKSILNKLPSPQQVTENYDDVLGEKLLEALNELPVEEKWDSILVDEAHTFCPSWFQCCVAAIKDPENGDLMIVSDASQNLYNRGKFTWKSVGIKAQGRTKKLDRNYRNTQEILSAAWSVLPHSKEEDEEDVTFPVVKPSAAVRNGSRPVLQICLSRPLAVTAVTNKIQELHKAGYNPKDIAIIYRYKSQKDTPLFENLVQQLNESGVGCYWITKDSASKAKYSSRQGGVRLVTALSSLGLEFKAVLIPWVEQFGDKHSQEPEAAVLSRRQLYVAMTRAQNELQLFGCNGVPLIDELVQSQYLEVLPLVADDF
jgi:hypothetical protein